MDKTLKIKNSASNGKGLNFCLDSAAFKKIVHQYFANEIVSNSLYHGSSGLGALRDIFYTLTNSGQMGMYDHLFSILLYNIICG